ncbi:MAG TPA: HNH endonuclease [Clostridiaceae bacterium]|nr:HNH endonuclease [Clostridiaceae bacterium]
MLNGYEGIYQISNLGNVKNIKYNRRLNPTLGKGGYLTVLLSRNNKHKRFYIHRLVAENFIEKNIVVNHKNFNKLDNRVENLEWCSQGYNVRYSYEKGRMPLPPPSKTKRIKRNDGKVYKSIEEAGKDMKIHPSTICNQLKNRTKTAGGYTFMYSN